MKRTSMKVKVIDGMRTLTRTVYECDGRHYFKVDGEAYLIKQNTEGRRAGKYYAMFFPIVEYI
jgi:hypothetical protein